MEAANDNPKAWIKWLLLIVILAVGAALRLTALDWDEYQHYHPDERYITWVATTIEWPSNWHDAIDPQVSSLNPFQWPPDAASEGISVLSAESRNFTYGHLPLYLGVAATRLAERVPDRWVDQLPPGWLLTRDILNGRSAVEFNHLTAVSRATTALFDVVIIGMLFLLGRRLYGNAAGLLAAALLALNVLHIQLARFFTVDPYQTAFTVLAIYLMVVSAQQSKWRHQVSYGLLAAASVGLAVGSKSSAVILLLPLTLLFIAQRQQSYQNRLLALIISWQIVILAFILTNPYALIDRTCQAVTPALNLGTLRIPAIDWKSCFLANVIPQGQMVRGAADFPFTRQYAGTWPYLYHLETLFKWSLGPLVTLSSLAGVIWALVRTWRARPGRSEKRGEIFLLAEAVVLVYTLSFLLVSGSFYVKFPRYLLPVIPYLVLYAAIFLLRLGSWLAERLAVRPVAVSLWKWLPGGVALLTSLAIAVAFSQQYRQPHPWAEASRWLHQRVPVQSLILSEKWDEPLPSSMEIDGSAYYRSRFRRGETTWLSGVDEADDFEKLRTNLEKLSQADYLVIASNRVYGVVSGQPERYPISSQFYALLFGGQLGYEAVFVADRGPTILGWRGYVDTFSGPGLARPPAVQAYRARVPSLSWGRADESLTVYDSPLVIIWENRDRMTVEEMEREFQLEEGQSSLDRQLVGTLPGFPDTIE